MKEYQVRTATGLITVPGKEVKIEGFEGWDIIATRPLRSYTGRWTVPSKEDPDICIATKGWVMTEKNTGLVLLGNIEENSVKLLTERWVNAMREEWKTQFPEILKEQIEKYGIINT